MNQLPTIIDIEASGFGQHSYPIEIGVVDSHQKRFCTLINPAEHWTHWDAQAEQTHHIAREILIESGRSVVEVAQMLNERYFSQTLYSDGWVVDKPWLITLFHTAQVEMGFSISPLELILSEQQMSCWHETKNKVMWDLRLERHRASNDALIIQETYKRTRAIADQLRA